MVLLANRFPRLISILTSTIFVSETSGIMSILKYMSVNPIDQMNGSKDEFYSIRTCLWLKEFSKEAVV